MKIAYIAHPISGNVEANLAKIRAIVRHINMTEPDTMPFVPYYADIVSMDDSVPAERARGIANDTAILSSGCVTELRVYGGFSHGVLSEMKLAQQLGIPVIIKFE